VVEEVAPRSGRNQWFSLALRREFYAEASLGQGIVIRVWLEGGWPLGGGARVVAHACSGPRHSARHSVGENGAVVE
jgi:hypothetical protein